MEELNTASGHENMKQAGETVAHWMKQAKKFGLEGLSDQLKFAAIAQRDFDCSMRCKQAHMITVGLESVADAIRGLEIG